MISVSKMNNKPQQYCIPIVMWACLFWDSYFNLCLCSGLYQIIVELQFYSIFYLDQTLHVYCVSHKVPGETGSILNFLCLMKQKPSHQFTLCFETESRTKSMMCLHLKMALSTPGNLKANYVNNALLQFPDFQPTLWKWESKEESQERRCGLEMKWNVTGRNYKVKKPFVHTMEHNFVVDIFFKLVFYHTVFLCKILCVVLKWISFCPNQWISPLAITYSPS